MSIFDRDPENFDFEGWMTLYKEDPAKFEEKRREVLDAEIARAPQHLQQRLRGLQWRVDAERRKYKNPLSSASRLYTMMWEKVYGENGLIDALDGMVGPGGQARNVGESVKNAQTESRPKVIQFRTASSS